VATSLPTFKAPYHQQDRDVFCGPAVAQMILAPIAGALVLQGTLKAAMQSSSIPEQCTLVGGTGAMALAFGMNAQHTAKKFSPYLDPAQPAAMARITGTLSANVAAAALVYGGKHWVAVTAVTTDSLGQGVWFNNPMPVTPKNCVPNLPPTHTASDGCGTGGSHPCERGAKDHAVLTDWLTTFFEPCILCAEHAGKPLFITVGLTGLTAPPAGGRGPSGGLSRIGAAQSANPSSEAVIDAARSGIERFGLASGRAEITADPPRRVRRIDRENEFYYLVPVQHEGDWTVVARIDAQSVSYAGSQVRSAGGYHIIEPEEALLQLAGFDEYKLSRDALTVLPDMVWRPCREAASPYYPLYQIDFKGVFFRFIGYDGTVYTELHDLLNGEPIRSNRTL
jgi:hypothetical protein